MKKLMSMLALAVGVQMLGAQPHSGPFPVPAPASTLTNQTSWALYTNLTAYSSGVWYNFSNSVTAGFNEIDNLSGNYPTNAPGGNSIELQAGTYPFTAPIVLSHNTKITGAGMWATVLKYAGTNRFTTNTVMMSVPNFNTHFPLFDPNGAGQLTNAALIRLMQLNSLGGWGPNYTFKDFSVQNASNQACILIAGVANNIYEDGIGRFGPDIFTTNSFGADLQYAAYPPTALPLVVGQAIFGIQTWTTINGLTLGLADGDLNIGNSYYNSFNEGSYFIGQDPTQSNINGYPTTNWLSMGVAIFSGEIANFGASIKAFFPYFNTADIWVHGSSCDIDDSYWQGSVYNILVSGPANVSDKEAPGLNTAPKQVLYNGTVFSFQDPNPNIFTNGLYNGITFSSTGGFTFSVNGFGGTINSNGWTGNVKATTIKGGTFTGNGSGITNATTSYTTNDLVTGNTNINNTTHTIIRTIPVVVSQPATTLGHAEIDVQLFVGNIWVTVADCEIAGGATSIIATNKSTLTVIIPSGVSLRITNSLSGTGYVAGLDAGGTNTYSLLP